MLVLQLVARYLLVCVWFPGTPFYTAANSEVRGCRDGAIVSVPVAIA